MNHLTMKKNLRKLQLLSLTVFFPLLSFSQHQLDFPRASAMEGSSIENQEKKVLLTSNSHVTEEGDLYCAEDHNHDLELLKGRQNSSSTKKDINNSTNMKNTIDPMLPAPVNSGVYKWSDYPAKSGEMRESRTFLEGSSPHFEYLRIHATTQFPGAAPSKAHANKEHEECIIVKEGRMKVTIEGKSRELGPGGVILLMPQQMHSLENVGKTNLSYYVMKYKSKKKMNIERGTTAGGSLMLDADSLTFKPSSRGGGRPYFDRPTAMCERFEMHVTQLDKKGPSHKPHVHIETEIILVINGETEMTIDGKEYKGSTGDFYFMDSQLLHGVRNATNQPCSYFAFKWN